MTSWIDPVFRALAASALLWTPLLLISWALARLLRGSARDCRLLWLATLIALPSMPLTAYLATSWSWGWSAQEWRAAAGWAVEEDAAAWAAPPSGEREPAAASSPSAAAAAAAAPRWPIPAAAALWLVGFLAFSLREGGARRRARELLRGSSPAPPALRDLHLEACRALGGAQELRRIAVRLSNVPVPLLVGALRPAVLLPAGAAQWPRERTRAALLHELCHARHGDPWADAAARWVTALFWFHPGVWLASGRLRHSMELAADAGAVSRGMAAEHYGSALLDIARGARLPASPAAGLAMARPGGLEVRLRSILSEPRRVGWALRAATAAGFSCLALAALLAAVAASASAAGARGGMDPWLQETREGWSLRCGGSAECRDLQAEAAKLLAAAGTSGAILVQDVATGQVAAYTARGPAPVPQVSTASVAKVALATLWWEAGLGTAEMPCDAAWTGRRGVSLTARGGVGQLEVPRQMLTTSCTTAAGRMMERLIDGVGQEKVISELEKLAFFPGASAPWLPEWLPSPRLPLTQSWAEEAPEMAVVVGRMATTPFHVAGLLQAIGADGMRRPAVLPGASPRDAERILGAKTARLMRSALADVVTEGTGQKALPILRDSSWRLLGKTGTWWRGEETYDGWFAGLAADGDGRSRYAVVVYLEGGGYGGAAATETAASMTRFLGERTRGS
ncbi:MAG: M56 family metallopeptidase [Acidobacteriota bacterium]